MIFVQFNSIFWKKNVFLFTERFFYQTRKHMFHQKELYQRIYPFCRVKFRKSIEWHQISLEISLRKQRKKISDWGTWIYFYILQCLIFGFHRKIIFHENPWLDGQHKRFFRKFNARSDKVKFADSKCRISENDQISETNADWPKIWASMSKLKNVTSLGNFAQGQSRLD